MRKPIEIRITRVNKERKGIALYRITSVYGLMDTTEHPWVCDRVKVQYHLDTLLNCRKDIPVIWD